MDLMWPMLVDDYIRIINTHWPLYSREIREQ